MKDKNGNELPTREAHLLTRGSLSQREGKILAKWYLIETGEDEQNCMCTNAQRHEIQQIIKDYLNNLPTNKEQ